MSSKSALMVAPPVVAEALGGSVIYEEYKGDFAKARSLAEAQLTQAQQAGDSSLLADALLARGVVHVLQGEPSAAIKCFQSIHETVPSDFDRRSRAMSYARLAKITQYNLFPGGNGASGIELNARWDGVAYTEAENPLQQEMLAQAHAQLTHLEASLVHGLLCNLQSGRAFVESGRANTSPQLIRQLLNAALQSPINFYQLAQSYSAASSLLAFPSLAAADLYRRAGYMAEAGQHLERAHSIYQQNGDSAGQAACVMLTGDWLAARYSTPAVWNFSLQEGSSAGNDLAWTTEALESNQDGTNLTGAEANYDNAEALFEAVGALRGRVQLQIRRCYLALVVDNYDDAVTFARRAAETSEKCGDRLAYWLSQTQRVLCQIGKGEYPEEKSIAEQIGHWGASEGSFSYALGLGLFFCRAARHWLLRKGDYERSLACSQLAVATFRALDARVNEAQSLADQGAVYQALGEVKVAINFYEQAYDQYWSVHTRRTESGMSLQPHMVMLATNLFSLFQNAMDADGIERSALRLQALMTERTPAQGDINMTRTFIAGRAPLSIGDFDQALTAVQQYALDNLAQSMIGIARVQVPLYRALAARDAGEDADAGQFFAQAVHAAETMDPAQRDFHKAVVLGHQKAYAKAAASFKEYLTQGGANAGFVGSLADVLKAAGGQAGQLEIVRQQVRTHDQAFTMYVRLKAYDEAKAHLEALIQLTGSKWWEISEQPWQDLTNCAEMYEGLNDLDQAIIYYEQAIEALEARRSRLSREELKTSLAAGSNVQYLYFQAARTAVKQCESASDHAMAAEWAGRALSYLERGKARSLLDLMASSIMAASLPSTETATMRAWRSANAQLAIWRGLLGTERNKATGDPLRVTELEKQVGNVEEQVHSAEEALAKADPAFHRLLTVEAQILTLDQIRSALPPKTALLEYAFLGDDLLAWAITDEGVAVKHRAVDAKALVRTINDFHVRCTNPLSDGKAMEEGATALASHFLEPVTDALDACPNIIVVPYGAAHRLPFHVLPWAGEPLIAGHTVAYLPSASMIQFVRPGVWPTVPERLLAVGNPQDMAFRPPLSSVEVNLPALRGAEDEASYVASLFAEGQVLIGDGATKARVIQLLSRFPLVLLATHALLSEDAPLLSAVLLAGGETLNVYELMGLHLDADLIILSACRTALGELTRGDEVIGLTRGLLSAGARSAIVSLWQVNDISTSLLIGEFFRQLHTVHSPAVALQAAQNYLRRLSTAQIRAEVGNLRDAGYARDSRRAGVTVTAPDYRHPYFWAPFVLIG